MFGKYKIILLILFVLGLFSLILAQSNPEGPCFGCDNEPVLLADNSFEDHPSMDDIDDMPDFEGRQPKDARSEHGKKRKDRQEKKITPELEAKIVGALKEYFPKLHDRAATLKKNNPKIYKKLLRKLRRHIRKSREPREDKKDLISMIFEESEIDILIIKYKQSKNEKEKAKLKLLIREKLSEGFDKRENIQKKVIERIEGNIEKKKKAHSERIKNKESLIEDHLKKLLK